MQQMISPMNYLPKLQYVPEMKRGPKEMAHQLKELVALPGDQSVASSIKVEAVYNCLELQSHKIQCLFLASSETFELVVCTHMRTDAHNPKMHTHK